jgi:DNA-binding transcriptional LysR family regulator
MDRTAEMTAFVRAVDSGGFSGAARRLALTPSAVSKLVKRLEDRLGVRLLHRSTRRLQMTAEGEAYYAKAQGILHALDTLEAEVSESSTRPRGLLRLLCGSAFGMHQLTPAIPRFQQRYPEVELELTITDEQVVAKEDTFDLRIHVGPLEESSLVARRICTLERTICAAPNYLAQRGRPQTPDELLQHNCLWISNLPQLRRWPFISDDGVRILPVSGNLVANNAETVLQLAIAGVGIVRLPDIMVGEPIRAGQLVPILTEWNHVEPVPVHAAYPSGSNLSPKVRAMVDFLVETFSGRPWRRAAGG